MGRIQLVVSALVVLLVGAAFVQASIQRQRSANRVADEKYKYTWKSALYINATGNVTLRADAFVPVPRTSNETFPVVIFPNSWSCPQIEYITRALNLAEMGYVAMEYETRGWYTSGGKIDVAGPLDREDGSTMIDFVAEHAAEWHADMSKVAFMGISYGAGISMLMAGYDPRVTTAIAMSGWNNLTDLMYGNESPNKDTLHGLVSIAGKDGVPSQGLLDAYQAVITHTNMTWFGEYNDQRSPQLFLDSLNARKVPMLLSSNFMDHLFRPQYMMGFFELLEGPKRLLLNQGTHALPEGLGILIHDNFIWSHAYDWLDVWLRGGSGNGIMEEPEIQMQQGDSVFDQTYVPYSNMSHAVLELTMTPRAAGSRFGGLAAQQQSAASGLDHRAKALDTIRFSTERTLTEPHPSEKVALGEPFIQNLSQPLDVALLFLSEPLQATQQVCGTPVLSLTINASAPEWQFFSYLYKIEATDTSAVPEKGTLWSRGFFTNFVGGPSAGTPAVQQADGTWRVEVADLHTICRVAPAGTRFALGIVLYDEAFQMANDDHSLEFTVVTDGTSGLSIPTVASE